MARKELNNGKSSEIKKKNVIWTTKRVDTWMKDYSEGIIHKDTPWLDGTIGVRSPSLVFEYTPEEIEELTKCARDIMYFANKYCFCLQGSRGYQPLTLRDYQEEMLKSYVDNRFSICCASRQIGKCFFNGKIYINNNGEMKNILINELYHNKKENKTFLQKLKNYLYKLYQKL